MIQFYSSCIFFQVLRSFAAEQRVETPRFQVMFGLEDEDLHDSGLEGSHDEHRIFQEVFYGNDPGGANNNGLVSEFINFECEGYKITGTSPCSNSDNSAITSQSSRSLLPEDPDMNKNFGGTAASGCSPESLSLAEGGDQDKSAKRIKLSIAKPSNVEPDPIKVLASSELPKDINSGPVTGKAPASHTTNLYFVESSCKGVASGCSPPEQHAELDRGGDANDLDALNCTLLNSDGNAGVEMAVTEAVASSISQESTETGPLLPSPVAVMDKPGPLHAKEFNSAGQNVNALNTDSKMDPRTFLQNYVNSLLLTAGWSIERRKRPSRKYMESVYRSPEGRLFREFPKAWRVCGQLLGTNRYDWVQVDDGKEWSDISKFCSDLTEVLMNIEKEIDQSNLPNALARQWNLLDPFVNVVFIERKVGSLRKGDTVKAARSLVIDKNDNKDAVVALSDMDGEGYKPSYSNLLAWHSNPSLVAESRSALCEQMYCPCDEQPGNMSFLQFGVQTNGAAEYQTSVCTDVADKDIQFVVDLANEMGIQLPSTCNGKVTSPDMSFQPAYGLDNTCAQSCDYDFNLPIFAANGDDHMHFSLTEAEPVSTPLVTSGVPQQSGFCEEDGGHWVQASRFEIRDKVDTVSKKKIRRKSKKISEIRPTNDTDAHANDFDTKEVKGYIVPTKTKKSLKKSIPLDDLLHRVEKKGSKFKKAFRDGPKIGQKKLTGCQIKDDDLLVSAIIKNKDFSAGATRFTTKKKGRKVKAQMKLKGHKGSCRLLPKNQGKVGKHYINGKWSTMGAKTVLSWLIDVGVICLNDVIHYRNPNDNAVLKDGLITRDGIMCKCCSMVLSVSEFKSHAGFNLNRPCLNLFMESGKPFTLCQLQAWSTEYKTRKSRSQVVRTDDDDQNDDSCGVCGDVGELLCCDNCPSTFHRACLSAELYVLHQELPEGSWYCANCSCWICGELVNDRGVSSPVDGHKCSQCEHKYHDACQRGKSICEGVVSDNWFCGGSCEEVYLGLHSRVGISNHIADGFSWTLLKCIHEDQKLHSAPRLAFKADCNSKLAVALTIMEQCFQSMVDPRTGIDMIPQVLYNWGSEFARLNFHGFYTALLEKDDVIVSVASIRVHGVKVAEMPLIATCSNYRRQGMCRRLIAGIEEMLISFKVEKLVISAIPELVETWTKGFGFVPASADEKLSLNNISLMVFPGTVLLKKPLYVTEEEQPALSIEAVTCPVEEHVSVYLPQLGGNCSSIKLGAENVHGVEGPEVASNIVGNHFDAKPIIEAVEPSDVNFCPDEGIGKLECVNLIVERSKGSNMQEQFSKLSCGEPVSAVGRGQPDMPCNVQSVNNEACSDKWPQLVCELKEE